MRNLNSFLIWAMLTGLLLTSSGMALAETIAEQLDELINNDSLSKRTHIGVMVKDIESDEVLYDRNGSKIFTPASNVKLYTSAAALDIFGPDHRFRTTIGLTTKPIDGHVDGDIILVAGGDPVLTSEDLRELVSRVADEWNVSRINGDIVLDRSLFQNPQKGPGWAWDDDPAYYNMSLGPLMLDYNVLTVEAVANPDAPSPAVSLIPPASWPPINNTAVMKSPANEDEDPSSSLTITRTPFEEPILVSGMMNPGAEKVTRSLTMATPELWIRAVLRRMLEDEGITVRGSYVSATSSMEDAIRMSIHHDSKPLSEIIALFNKPSENAIGEMLFHHLAMEVIGETGSWSYGSRAMGQWLDQVAGLLEGTYSIRDGSGLSRYNMITPEGTIQLLDFMWDHPHKQIYIDSLPIAGVDGTARLRMRESAAFENVFAKSGTMTGVSCWSGYVNTKTRGTLMFSILTNGYIGSSGPSRDLQDRICILLAEQ